MSVIFMMVKDRYDYETSRTVFELFKHLVLFDYPGAHTPSNISNRLKRNLNSVSDQLSVLRDKKIVKVEKRGKERIYSVNWESFKKKAQISKKDSEGTFKDYFVFLLLESNNFREFNKKIVEYKRYLGTGKEFSLNFEKLSSAEAFFAGLKLNKGMLEELKEENENLKKENKNLKKEIAELKKRK